MESTKSSKTRDVIHGKCKKVEHLGGGYLHEHDDDSPYDVDGLSYCGRCHGSMEHGDKTAIASDQVIAEYLASAVVELRRLGMHIQGDGGDIAARLYTYAEMLQIMLPAVESLEKKGRALL